MYIILKIYLINLAEFLIPINIFHKIVMISVQIFAVNNTNPLSKSLIFISNLITSSLQCS